jgi:hypothetical protein
MHYHIMGDLFDLNACLLQLPDAIRSAIFSRHVGSRSQPDVHVNRGKYGSRSSIYASSRTHTAKGGWYKKDEQAFRMG